MVQHFINPPFTASKVAREVGKALGRTLEFEEPDDFDGLDSSVDISRHIHIQVGGDYLIVNAFADETTMKSWPVRQSITQALKDVKAALERFPEAA